MNGAEAMQLTLVDHMIMSTWTPGLHSYYTLTYYIEHTFLAVVK